MSRSELTIAKSCFDDEQRQAERRNYRYQQEVEREHVEQTRQAEQDAQRRQDDRKAYLFSQPGQIPQVCQSTSYGIVCN